MLTFCFTGSAGIMTQSEVLVSGAVGKQVRFEFSEEWEGLRKKAVYRAGGVTCISENVGDEDVIPERALAKPLRRLFVGVCGTDEEGQVVIPTVMVPGPFIHIGAVGGPEYEPEDPKWKDMMEALAETVRFVPQELTQAQQAQARENIGVSEGGGLSEAAAALLLSVLKKAVYTEDVSGEIRELAEALADRDVPEEPDIPDVPDVPDVPEEPEEPEKPEKGIRFVAASVFDTKLNAYDVPSNRMSLVTTEAVAEVPFPQNGICYPGDVYLLPVPAGTNMLTVKSPGLIGGPQFFVLEQGGYTCKLDAGWQTVDEFAYSFDADTYGFMAINFKNSDNSAFFTDEYDTSGITVEFSVAAAEPEEQEVPVTLSMTRTSATNNQRKTTVGQPYYNTLVPADGYMLDSIAVMMGDAYITETAVKGDKISIEKVTGAIMIMAVSVPEPVVTVSEIIMGSTSFVEGAGLQINRTGTMGARATVSPIGQYLKKGTTYRFSLGNAPAGFHFGVQIMVASAPGLVFDSTAGAEAYHSTVTAREVDTGWMQADYTYTPTEHNRIFTVNFKHDSGEINETHRQQLLENIIIEEVTQ